MIETLIVLLVSGVVFHFVQLHLTTTDDTVVRPKTNAWLDQQSATLKKQFSNSDNQYLPRAKIIFLLKPVNDLIVFLLHMDTML